MKKPKEYYIITPNFKGGKCENPLSKKSEETCGNSERLLWIKYKGKLSIYAKKTLYICAECIKKDYKLVGDWADSWEKEFSVEPIFKPNEK